MDREQIDADRERRKNQGGSVGVKEKLPRPLIGDSRFGQTSGPLECSEGISCCRVKDPIHGDFGNIRLTKVQLSQISLQIANGFLFILIRCRQSNTSFICFLLPGALPLTPPGALPLTPPGALPLDPATFLKKG